MSEHDLEESIFLALSEGPKDYKELLNFFSGRQQGVARSQVKLGAFRLIQEGRAKMDASWRLVAV